MTPARAAAVRNTRNAACCSDTSKSDCITAWSVMRSLIVSVLGQPALNVNFRVVNLRNAIAALSSIAARAQLRSLVIDRFKERRSNLQLLGVVHHSLKSDQDGRRAIPEPTCQFCRQHTSWEQGS
jgi:hypothetical protein